MSHLEMRKALAHGKSHFLSMESIASTFRLNDKLFLCEKITRGIQTDLADKKITYVISWHCEVKEIILS